MPVFNAGGAPSSVAALSSKLIPGRSVALKYDEDLWHEALLVAPAEDDGAAALGWTWNMMTPDGDEYVEVLDGSNPGPVSCMVLNNLGDAPRSISGRFYRFKDYPEDGALLSKMREFLTPPGGFRLQGLAHQVPGRDR